MKFFDIKNIELEKSIFDRIVYPALRNVYNVRGKNKQIGVLVKTLNLFNMPQERLQKYLKEATDTMKISINKDFRNNQKFTLNSLGHKAVTLVPDYFYFVFTEVDDEDLIIRNNRKIMPKEVKYYLYRLTKDTMAEGFSGTRYYHRNYFLSGFKNEYKKATGRTLTTHKIGHMNKILAKYNYIIRDINNKTYIGPGNPFFNSKHISNDSRAFIKNMPKNENRSVLNNQLHELTQENNMLKDINKALQNDSKNIDKIKDELKSKEQEHRIMINQIMDLQSKYSDSRKDLQELKDQYIKDRARVLEDDSNK